MSEGSSTGRRVVEGLVGRLSTLKGEASGDYPLATRR